MVTHRWHVHVEERNVDDPHRKKAGVAERAETPPVVVLDSVDGVAEWLEREIAALSRQADAWAKEKNALTLRPLNAYRWAARHGSVYASVRKSREHVTDLCVERRDLT